MSRREIRHTRRESTRQRRQAEQIRRRQAETGYWSTFTLDGQETQR
ncbi:hypothetical protein [Plantactinospora sp. CA-290183]